MTTEPNDDGLSEYLRKRDEILLSLNIQEARKFFSLPSGKSDYWVLLTLHKARYECVQMSREVRTESGVWLRDRGYRRMTGEPVRLFEDLSYVH